MCVVLLDFIDDAEELYTAPYFITVLGNVSFQLIQHHEFRRLIMLAGRVDDSHWPHPCEVANSVGIFRELDYGQC